MVKMRALVTILCLLVAVQRAEPFRVSDCPCSCRDGKVDCHLYQLYDFPAYLPKGAYSLNLSDNAIKEIPLKDPSKDAYKDIVVLDISYNRIETFTNESLLFVREQLRELNLSKNKLENLDANAFEGFTELVSLRIRTNHLKTLHGFTFGSVHLPNLTYLDISHNEIEEIDDDAFRGLEHLRLLNLEGNSLKAINSKIFRDLHELKELNLASNILTAIAPNAFVHLDQIDLLNLGWNRLSTDQKINGMKTLTTLSLHHNYFKLVPMDLLENLHRLKTLHLDNNILTSLDSTSFKNNEEIEELTISHSKINKIPVNVFTGLKNLRVLKASNSFINEIEVGAFTRNQHFHEISLRQNYLRTLDKNLFNWEFISHLDLQENPWDCDCSMAWIVNVTAISSDVKDTFRCSTPDGIRGQNMLSVFQLHHYNCSAHVIDHVSVRRRSVARIVILSLLVFSATVIVGGIAIICIRNRKKLKNHEQYTYSTIKQSKESVAESTSSEEGREAPKPERITADGARKNLGEDV